MTKDETGANELLCRCVWVRERGREGGRLQWLSIERCPLGIMASSAFQETTYNSWNIQWLYIQCFSHINTSHNGLLFNIPSSDIWVPRAESCYYRGKWGEHNNRSSKGLFPSCLTDGAHPTSTAVIHAPSLERVTVGEGSEKKIRCDNNLSKV